MKTALHKKFSLNELCSLMIDAKRYHKKEFDGTEFKRNELSANKNN